MALRVRYSGLDDLLLPDAMKSEDARSPCGGSRANRKGTSTTIQAVDHILGEAR
jgi:hypothetical protein